MVSGYVKPSQRVVQVSETFKLSRKFFADYHDSDSDDESSPDHSKNVSNSLGDAEDTFAGSEVIPSDNTSIDENDETESYPEVDDCLGTVLEFTGIECRIGNRLFKYTFPSKSSDRGVTTTISFKEIK